MCTLLFNLNEGGDNYNDDANNDDDDANVVDVCTSNLEINLFNVSNTGYYV
jgi:hypothetical protein